MNFWGGFKFLELQNNKILLPCKIYYLKEQTRDAKKFIENFPTKTL
jgi:hypothetical protein